MFFDLYRSGDEPEVSVVNDETPKWELVADQIVREYKYGDTITLLWLEEQLNPNPTPKLLTRIEWQNEKFKWLSDIESIKDKLLTQHKMYLDNIRGTGYKIVPPQEQTTVVMNSFSGKFNSALRKTKKGLVNIKEEALSVEQARQRVEAEAKLAYIKVFASGNGV